MRQIFFAAAVCGLALTTHALAQEPVYEGKPLSAWLEMLQDNDVSVRRSAAAQLALRINSEARQAAVPLADAMRDQDRKVRLEVAKAINKLGPAAIEQALLHLVNDLPKPAVKYAAARAIGDLGISARGAIPYLLRQIDMVPVDRLMQVYCARSIATIDTKSGKVIVEHLALFLKDPSKDVRMTAAEGLGDLGGAFINRSMPALQAALKDTSAEVRVAVARAITRVDRREMSKTVPTLVQILKDPAADAKSRTMAAEVLGEFGPIARTALDQLRGSLTNDDAQVRLAAATAMAMIDKQAGVAEAVPVFVAALKHTDADVRLAGAEALKQLGADAKAAVPALIGTLKTEAGNFTLYVSVLDAVARIGEPAVASLVAALTDPATDPTLTRALVECLGKIGKPAKDAAPALVDILKDRRKVLLHRYVVAALGKIGSAASPALKPLLKDEDPKVRLAAVQAFGEMGTEAKPNLPDLREVAKGDADEAVKNAAVAAVKRLDPFGA